MNSLYVHKTNFVSKISGPVYGSACGRNYKDWLVNFSTILSSYITDPFTNEISVSCLPAIKKDIRTAEFLLPHIIVSVICSGENEGVDVLVHELNAILPEEGDTTPVECVDQMVEGNTDKLVAQTFFGILDHLRSWLKAKYSANIKALGKLDDQLRTEEIQKATRDKQYQAVIAFTSRIPDVSLANLSYSTEAYHRSAFYLDKTFASEQYSEPQLNAMQQLYASLEEYDLVVGISAVRGEEPSLESKIMYNMATGNFQDALCCFERQIKDGNTNYSGLIQCYLNIDQPSKAANLSAGLIAKDASWAKDLAPLQAEAAWQLGQWQDLNKFTKLETATASSSWEMSLSKVILSAYKMDKFLFCHEIKAARMDVLKSLSALSSEESAYKKSYLHVGRLAMLREVEMVAEKMLLVNPVAVDSFLDKFDDLLNELESRLNYSQVSWTNFEPLLRLRRGIFTAGIFSSYATF